LRGALRYQVPVAYTPLFALLQQQLITKPVIIQYDDKIVLESLKGSANATDAHSPYLELLEKIVILFDLILKIEHGKRNELT